MNSGELMKKISAALLIALCLNSCSSAKEAAETEASSPPQNSNNTSNALPVPEVLNIVAAGSGCPGGNINVSKKSVSGEIEITMPDLRAESDSDAGVSIGRSNCTLSFEAVTTSPSPVRLELLEATLDVEPEITNRTQNGSLSTANASVEVFQGSLRGDTAETEISDATFRGIQSLKTRDLILSSDCGRSLPVRINTSVRIRDGAGTIQATTLRLRFREGRCN